MFKRPSNQELTNALNKCYYWTYQSHLKQLNKLNLCPPPQMCTEINLLKIKKLPTSEAASFFTSTLQALGNLNTVVGFLIYAHKDTSDFYIALKYDTHFPYTLSLLINGFTHAFPHASFQVLNTECSNWLLSRLLSAHYINSLSSVQLIPNTSYTTPPLEQFMKQMTRETYVALFLATSMDRNYLLEEINQMSTLHTVLSRYTNQIFLNSQQVAKNNSNTITCNDSSTKSSSLTENNGQSSSQSETHYTNLAASTPIPITEDRNINFTLTFNHAHSDSLSNSNSCAQCNTLSNGDSRSEANQTATNLSNNKSCTFTEANKTVIDQLAYLSSLLNYMNSLTSSSCFSFNSYFLSPHIVTSIHAAYTFAGLVGNAPSLMPNTFINTWQQNDPDFTLILRHLRHLDAPCFSAGPAMPSTLLHTLVSAPALFSTLYFSSQISN